MLYHKIQTLFKRTEKGEMITGAWTDPVFEYLAGNLWRCTEKIDGTNIRVTIDPISETIRSIGQAEVRFDGRTDDAALPARLVNWMVGKFFDKTMLKTLKGKFPDGAILYGEGCGDGIGKMGAHYGPQQGFVLFDVNVGGWWLQQDAVNDVAETLELRCVKEVGCYTLHEAIDIVEKGYNSEFGNFLAEGLVAEPCVPMFNRKGERVITKIKTCDFTRTVELEKS